MEERIHPSSEEFSSASLRRVSRTTARSEPARLSGTAGFSGGWAAFFWFLPLLLAFFSVFSLFSGWAAS